MLRTCSASGAAAGGSSPAPAPAVNEEVLRKKLGCFARYGER